jgi:hypothetical protein
MSSASSLNNAPLTQKVEKFKPIEILKPQIRTQSRFCPSPGNMNLEFAFSNDNDSLKMLSSNY